MKKTNTHFEKVLRYFNKNLGKIVTNIDIECDFEDVPFTTVAYIRSYLVKNGFIKKLEKTEYLVEKRIPLNIKIQDLRWNK